MRIHLIQLRETSGLVSELLVRTAVRAVQSQRRHRRHPHHQKSCQQLVMALIRLLADVPTVRMAVAADCQMAVGTELYDDDRNKDESVDESVGQAAKASVVECKGVPAEEGTRLGGPYIQQE